MIVQAVNDTPRRLGRLRRVVEALPPELLTKLASISDDKGVLRVVAHVPLWPVEVTALRDAWERVGHESAEHVEVEQPEWVYEKECCHDAIRLRRIA